MSIENITEVLKEAIDDSMIHTDIDDLRDELSTTTDELADLFDDEVKDWHELIMAAAKYIEQLEANVAKTNNSVLCGEVAEAYWDKLISKFEL